MESQMAHPHCQSHEQESHILDRQTVPEGEEEHHHEKKWVLKKVKAKAKKIKDTLTKHGHGHNHDHIPDDHAVEEEDTEEEETLEDPEIHGAPLHQSAAIKSIGQVENSGQYGINAGRSTAMGVDPPTLGQNVEPEAGSHIHEQDERKAHPEVNLGLTSVLGEVPNAPQNTPAAYTAPGTRNTRTDMPTRTFVPGQEEHAGQPTVNLERPKGLEEDPAAPKGTPGAYTSSNCQSKATDPTGRGGEEVGITSVLRSLDEMNVHDESKTKSAQEQNWPTGTADFYTSVLTGSHDQFSPELPPPKPVTVEETSDSTKTHEHLHDDTADTNRHSKQSSYTDKISSATSVIADKAISTKNVVVSNLGYGEKDNTGRLEMDEGDESSSPASAVDYGKKIAATVKEKLTPVCEKVVGPRSTVLSKMPGTNTGTDNQKERDVGGQDKVVSVKDYFAEKLRPGEEDRALSEVISEALHRKKAEQENKSTTSRPLTDKRKEEPDEETKKAMETVTESEDVARRLGPTEHDSSTAKMSSSYADNSGKGVVDKIKGAVGSWFSKGEENQGSQQSFNCSVASPFEEAGNDSSITTAERRLQKPGN